MKRPFIMFAVNDHLGDTAVRMCPAFARGVWWDMICLMAAGEPFGYLRLDPPKLNRADLSKLNRDASTKTDRAEGSSRSGSAIKPPGNHVEGSVRFNVGGTVLPPSGSLEALLPALTGTPPEVVTAALQILEANGVFARDVEGALAGIIYSRRMRREDEDRQRKQKAYDKYKSGRRKGGGSAGLNRDEGSELNRDASTKTDRADPPARAVTRTITRTRDITTNPPDPPLPGGAPQAGDLPTPGGKKTRRRGAFDDNAIRRRAELNDKTRGKA